MGEDTYNADERRVIAEITRLWTSTQKSQDQLSNQELLLSQFFLMAEKYPYTALLQTVDRWIEENRWFPAATKDFEDELRTARSRVVPQIEARTSPWLSIRMSSILTWARQLVGLYQREHGHLPMQQRHQLESQAMDMVLNDGEGGFGVHPHPIWTAQDCLRRTRYA